MFLCVYNFLAKALLCQTVYMYISLVSVCVCGCCLYPFIYRFWCLFNSHYDRWKYDWTSCKAESKRKKIGGWGLPCLVGNSSILINILNIGRDTKKRESSWILFYLFFWICDNTDLAPLPRHHILFWQWFRQTNLLYDFLSIIPSTSLHTND